MKAGIKIALLVFLIGFTSSLFSQDFWEELYFPDSTNILSIAINTQSDIFIGAGKNGGTGGIYRSSDSGQMWEFLGMPEHIFRAMAINSNGDIYAGSSQSPQYGGLFRSIDNGETWVSILPEIGVYGNIVHILPLGDTIFVSIWMGGAAVIRSTDNGQTWELVFATNNSSEYVTDILKSNTGELFISLTGYFENMGGVYKSGDGGENWKFIGLFNYMITSLAMNSSNDLFAGSWGYLSGSASSGFYVLRNGEEEWDELYQFSQVQDVVISSEDHIYFSSSMPNGVIRSLDNGRTFEFINEGLPEGPMGQLSIDNHGFIYLTTTFLSNFLAKSINPTVSIPEFNPNPLNLYPNPVTNSLNVSGFNSYGNPVLVKIKIYNSLGVKIRTKTVGIINDQLVLDLGDLSSGFYLVFLSFENHEITQRIIIK